MVWRVNIDDDLYQDSSGGGGVPDDAFQVDDVRVVEYNFDGSYATEMDLGTGGYAKLRWRRVGRQIEGWVSISIAADATPATSFAIIIHPDDLPATPASGGPEYQSSPGGFGAMYKPDSNGTPPYNGFRVGLSPLVTTLGASTEFAFFKSGSETAIQAAADNLWSPATGNPVPAADVPGAVVVGRFYYEAADAV